MITGIFFVIDLFLVRAKAFFNYVGWSFKLVDSLHTD